ncbi:MAG: hypothetical protein QF662_01490, partial [Phycisphaerae bacterium]|nr:hypothetical protein [Phycisphaerae bacterium]
MNSLPGWTEKRILVTVKAYPNPSKKYRETTCTAGIVPGEGWIRLHPIQFRLLPGSQQYKKYQWISVHVRKHNRD